MSLYQTDSKPSLLDLHIRVLSFISCNTNGKRHMNQTYIETFSGFSHQNVADLRPILLLSCEVVSFTKLCG